MYYNNRHLQVKFTGLWVGGIENARLVQEILLWNLYNEGTFVAF